MGTSANELRPGSAPRAFIVKCLNYKDTENILRAARAKKRGDLQGKQNKIPPGPFSRRLQTTDTVRQHEKETARQGDQETPDHLPRQTSADHRAEQECL